jgi:hypothetical protein
MMNNEQIDSSLYSWQLGSDFVAKNRVIAKPIAATPYLKVRKAPTDTEQQCRL